MVTMTWDVTITADGRRELRAAWRPVVVPVTQNRAPQLTTRRAS
jgi:hypothetical protein